MSNPPTLSVAVTDNIRACMARKRLSQRDVAAALGISQPSLSQKLANKRPLHLDEVEAFAIALGVSVASLLEDAA